MARLPFNIGGVTITVSSLASGAGFTVFADDGADNAQDRLSVLSWIGEGLATRCSFSNGMIRSGHDGASMVLGKDGTHGGGEIIQMTHITKVCEQLETLVGPTHDTLLKYQAFKASVLQGDRESATRTQADKETEKYRDAIIDLLEGNNEQGKKFILDAHQKNMLAKGIPLVLNDNQKEAIHEQLAITHMQGKERS